MNKGTNNKCKKPDDCILKVCKNNLNSNVQYVGEFFDAATQNSWGIVVDKDFQSSGDKEKCCKKDKCCNRCENKDRKCFDEFYWVANNGSNTLGKYTSRGELLYTVDVTGGLPTGLVKNYTDFFGNYKLITVTENGTIEGYSLINPIATVIVVSNPGAIYTGVSLTKKRLYVCNFASGYVEIYDRNFTFLGQFTDDALANSGYAPYNVAVHGKYVYVTYARQDASKTVAFPGIGFGYVDKFSRTGELLFRFINREPLNAPWGLMFSECGNCLYVGNNGDGRINIFDTCEGFFIKPLSDVHGNPIEIGNLWGLALGRCGIIATSGMDNEFCCGGDRLLLLSGFPGATSKSGGRLLTLLPP